MHVALVKRISGSQEQSPEHRLLRETQERVLAQVFNKLSPCYHFDGKDLEIPPEADVILVQGLTDAYFAVQSIRRMRLALEGGAAVVVPTPVHRIPTAGRSAVYTLRDFEDLERALLAEDHKVKSDSPSHLPISLFTRTVFEQIRSYGSLEDLFEKADLLEELAFTVRPVVREGVFFQMSDFYGEVRKDILPHLPSKIDNLLEVGCARGRTGAFIKEKYGCKVTGVDLNAEVTRDAENRLDRVISGDFENLNFTEKFDAIVATELIEHLRWPEKAFRKMYDLLNPHGRVVITTPNVGHYSIVEDLIAGRWDYVPAGLLCYTHFRFFTKSTLEDFIERAGIRRYQIIPQYTEIPKWPSGLDRHLAPDLDSLKTKGFYVILEAEG